MTTFWNFLQEWKKKDINPNYIELEIEELLIKSSQETKSTENKNNIIIIDLIGDKE